MCLSVSAVRVPCHAQKLVVSGHVRVVLIAESTGRCIRVRMRKESSRKGRIPISNQNGPAFFCCCYCRLIVRGRTLVSVEIFYQWHCKIFVQISHMCCL